MSPSKGSAFVRFRTHKAPNQQRLLERELTLDPLARSQPRVGPGLGDDFSGRREPQSHFLALRLISTITSDSAFELRSWVCFVVHEETALLPREDWNVRIESIKLRTTCIRYAYLALVHNLLIRSFTRST